MRIYIDASVFVKQERSLGQVFGTIDLPSVPNIGMDVAFRSPVAGVSPIALDGFAGTLKVTNVQLAANSDDGEIVVNLEDIVVNTESDGRAVMAYLRDGFALSVDEA